jgi:hypothetical protein
MKSRDRFLRTRRVSHSLLLGSLIVLAARGVTAAQRIQQGDGPSGGEPSTVEAIIATGDFDGDGRIDQAAIAGDGGVIRVTYGEPDGTFSAPVLVPAGNHPARLQMADLNGDLQDDLAVFSARGVLRVLLGGAGRAFEAIGPLGEASPSYLAARDPVVEGHPSCLDPPFDPAPHGTWNFTIDLGGLEIRDGALLWWATDCESNVQAFNVVRLLFHGGTVERVQLNAGPIPCQGCTNSGGYSYTCLLPRHRGIHNLFIEAVLTDGRLKYQGPGVIDMRPAPFP